MNYLMLLLLLTYTAQYIVIFDKKFYIDIYVVLKYVSIILLSFFCAPQHMNYFNHDAEYNSNVTGTIFAYIADGPLF